MRTLTKRDKRKTVKSRETSVLKSIPKDAKLGRCRKIAPTSHAVYTEVKLMKPLHKHISYCEAALLGPGT